MSDTDYVLQQETCTVDIEVKGLKKTSESFMHAQAEGIRQAETFGDLLQQCELLQTRLRSRDAYKSAVIRLHQDPHLADDTGINVRVDIEVEEAFPYKLSTGVEFDRREAIGKLQGKVLNTFGHHETLSASFSEGHAFSNEIEADLDIPHIFHNASSIDLLSGNLTIFRRSINYESLSSHTQLTRGSVVRLASAEGMHALQLETSWRDILPLNSSSKAASPSICYESLLGSHTKTSLQYTFLLDRLDHSMAPLDGFLFKSSVEAAGSPGDLSFVKGQVDTKIYYPLFTWMSIGFSMRTGLLQPLRSSSGLSGHSFIGDRFFLGGHSTLRGFDPMTVCPRDAGDCLGGDVLYASNLSLLFPQLHPVLEQYNVQGQLFFNAGSTIKLDGKSLSTGTFSSLAETTRSSIGAGIILPFFHGRLELSTSIPLRQRPGDSCSYFQWGVSLDFI